MSSSRVVVVGDVVNDIVVLPHGPIRPDTDTSASVTPRPGGSGANTAAWLGALGAAVDFVGCVGADSAAWHEGELRAHGVVPHLVVDPGLVTGTIVVIVDGEQRTMLTERGANSALRPAHLSDAVLGQAAVLHLSGYSVLDGLGLDGSRELIARAVAQEVRVSVNPGSAGYLGEFGGDRFLEAVAGASVFFPNLEEGRLLSGEEDAERIAAALLEVFPLVVLTLGPEGALVATRGEPAFRVAAPQVARVDPTGAGDAFAAGFLASWPRSPSLAEAAEAGVRAGGRAVTVVGGRPAL